MSALTESQINDLVLVDDQQLPLDQNPALVYLAGLNSAGGRRVQRQALAAIAELLTGSPDVLSCNWAALRFQHTAAVRARLAERYSPATANRMLSALRGTLESAWRLGQMDAESFHRAADVKTVIGSTLPAGRELTPEEIAALIQACENDSTPAGVRDRAIISLGYTCGPRRSEIPKIDLEDYDPENSCLILHGKRKKERTGYVLHGTRLAIDAWLQIRGSDPGPLFWPVNKGGILQPRRMTDQAIYNLLEKRGAEAGVKDFSPHDLRRTFVSDLLDAGADIEAVQKLAGHKNVNTTIGYSRRGERIKKEAAGLLHVPYKGKLV